MFEVFFAPQTDDEREFQHACWLLSGFVIRENHLPPDPTALDKILESRQQIEEMRERIRSTIVYASLTDAQQRRVLAGKRNPKKLEDRLRVAGFGPATFKDSYAYLSSYVHSDGLSAMQIMQAMTKKDQLEYIKGAKRIAMIVMAKMILEYRKLFPSAETSCLANPQALRLAEIWAGAASILE